MASILKDMRFRKEVINSYLASVQHMFDKPTLALWFINL